MKMKMCKNVCLKLNVSSLAFGAQRENIFQNTKIVQEQFFLTG